MRAIFIDARNRRVTYIELDEKDSLAGLQKCVEGYIERATTLPNGDDVFVNEEGLFQGWAHGFAIVGGHQPFLGNGVIISHGRNGDSKPAKSTLEDIKNRVSFLF